MSSCQCGLPGWSLLMARLISSSVIVNWGSFNRVFAVNQASTSPYSRAPRKNTCCPGSGLVSQRTLQQSRGPATPSSPGPVL